MKFTIAIDDELFAKAQQFAGTEPNAKAPPRRRPQR